MRGFKHTKAVQALAYIANTQDNREINKMRALKLIWLADRLHLRKYGRTLTGDHYVAMKFGPVPSSTRDILQQNTFSLSQSMLEYANNFIAVTGKWDYRALCDVNMKVFSETDIEVLSEIVTTYRKLSPFDLRDMSHDFPEWRKFEEELLKNPDRAFPMDMKDFFEDAVKEHPFFDGKNEEIELMKSLFLREDQA
jgi:uncharacterized phage-associated protein